MNDNLPNHIAIIPDGNRRWAKGKGLEAWDGHEAGALNAEKLIRRSLDMGIKCLSFWGSSLDNLKKRPVRENLALMKIYEKYFTKLFNSDDIHKNEARINIIGKWREQLPGKLKNILEKGINETKDFKKHLLNFFLAYNGDAELLGAIRKIAKDFKPGTIITAETVKSNLMTKELPPVNLLIRTGGEPHLSAGFMMWDIANAQLYFSDKYFPDFSAKELDKAIEDYQSRGRRLGK
ncbi:MAG: di-trans,poly-cis-decaprenylcistransferase [Candidatus Moranbacteria bacterium RIFCSPHIGHO2_02_FULL_40_12b]|nr:MAG: di-trans,poly-cis-decaprenylcistransferase [Candidatus Moranbacteria bacterium RIFCSPHIGHO2_02_FULL_40_12b]